MPEQNVAVTDDIRAGRYRASVDGTPAGFAAYVQRGDVLTFTHTEIDPAFEGRGVGSALARGALDDVRARGLRIRALCPFIAHFVATHSDYADLQVR